MKKNKQTIVDTVFVLGLFCFFCLTSISVVLVGLQVYKNIVGNMEDSFSLRTASAYLTEKARQNDVQDSVSLIEVEGEKALCFDGKSQETQIQTIVYYYQGYLREITMAKGQTLSPHIGEKLIALEKFQIQEMEKNLYEITLGTRDNGLETVILAFNSPQNKE